MDSITEAYNRMYMAEGLPTAAGAARAAAPLVMKGATGTGISAAQAWPEYNRYRDEGMSHEDAVKKAASVLGISALGSTIGGGIGGAIGAPSGPGAIASTAGGSIVGGQAAAALFDELFDQYNATGKYGDKRQQERMGVVWDGEKYVHKPENLTRYRGEADEDFAKRQADGKARAAELNKNPVAPTWLKWEQDKAKKAQEKADLKRRSSSTATGEPSGWNANNDPANGNNAEAPKTYTVGGITYDMATGRPVKDQPAAPTNSSAHDTSELDDIINEPYTADQNIPDNEPGDVTKPEDVAKPEDKGGGKPEDKKGDKPEDKTGGREENLTPMQQWAKNFPALAAKVKPGQAGYDEIQALKKPQNPGAVGGGVVAQRAQQLQQLRTGKAETPVATASSLYKKPEQPATQSAQASTPNKPGGLMDKLSSYQAQHGYGSGSSSSSTPSGGTQSSNNTPTSSNNNSRLFPNQDAKTLPGRAVGAGWDAASDTIKTIKSAAQGTGNAAQRAWQSEPAEKVKDAVKDTATSVGRSAAVQTVKNQGQKALGALNNKRKEWTAPLGSNE